MGNLKQQDSSYRHYEEVVSAIVRDPGDGQQKDDDDDLIALAPTEANIKKNPKTIQDQVRAGSSGLTPFQGVKLVIYDEISKPTSDRVDKRPENNALSNIPEAIRSCASSMPSLTTVSFASEIKTSNNNTDTKDEESLYEKPIEV